MKKRKLKYGLRFFLYANQPNLFLLYSVNEKTKQCYLQIPGKRK